MASANSLPRVTELDFTTIKTNLKNFLKSQNVFLDYDFEGSTMSYMLDVLAYNTYYNAYYTNMVANEMFLDSALIRENAVSRAKELGYTPRSAVASSAQINLNFTPTDNPIEIVIPAYTRFSATLDNIIYEFTNDENVIVTNQNGVYSYLLTIFEGIVLTYTFTYNSINNQTIFELPNPGLDTSSLVVQVSPSATSTNVQKYELATDLTEITADSQVYFIEENMNGNYQIYFGDGVLGQSLSDNNIVKITGRFCNGSDPAGINVFTNVGYVGYNKDVPTTQYTPSRITTITAANGGQPVEDIDSIKKYAPKIYELQNRLITKNDYTNYILSHNKDIEGISIWGGEENDPPLYGKVLMSIKIQNDLQMSETRKNQLLSDLSALNSLTIDPLIIDPIYIYIIPSIQVKYNPSQTTLSASLLGSKISSAVQDFERTQLGSFDRSFRFSKFSTMIDATDTSIDSNETTILLEKRFTPILNTTLTYELDFNIALLHPYDGYLGTLQSTSFTLSGNAYTLYLDDDGFGKLRLYYYDNKNLKKYYKTTGVGSINYVTGKVVLNSFVFNSVTNTEMSIKVQPAENDYTPVRNQIILFSHPEIFLLDSTNSRLVKATGVDVQGNITINVDNGVLTV